MRILIIDDDGQLCQNLAYQLKKKGINADICLNGEDGLEAAGKDIYDLLLLDRMLPGLSGTEVLSAIREDGIQTPVILVTALGDISQRVQGLDAGADDYLVKPIAFEELMARIRSIQRRPRNLTDGQLLRYHDLSLDLNSKILSCNGESCSLSRKEGDLLEVFLRHPGTVLARNLILTKVWGIDTEIEDGNLDNYIHFLRRRLRSVHSTMSIRTVRGIGYCLEV